jgi:hypothetical protein
VKPGNAPKRQAGASAAVVERKKRPKTSNVSTPRSGIKCFDCGQKGHTAAYCRRFLQNQTDNHATGDAQMADAESEDEEDEDALEVDNEDEE